LKKTPKVKPVSVRFFGGKLDCGTRFLFGMKPLKKRQAEAPTVRPARGAEEEARLERTSLSPRAYFGCQAQQDEWVIRHIQAKKFVLLVDEARTQRSQVQHML
jgi:hypothetical protein